MEAGRHRVCRCPEELALSYDQCSGEPNTILHLREHHSHSLCLLGDQKYWLPCHAQHSWASQKA